MTRLPTISDRVMAIEAAAAAVISVAIALASQNLVFMTVFVPLVIAARFAALAPIQKRQWGFGMGVEALFFAACTIVGAFNDWNSVVNHRIYDYNVPVFAPELTTIPFWMLLYWGFILRSLVTLFRWERLVPPDAPYDKVTGFSTAAPVVKLIGQFALILVTRQFIYRLYEEPVWSWVPFAAAIVVYFAMFRPRAYELKLVGAFLLGGPLIEILYIQAGDLHAYHHGILAGVPVWIALWWVLAVIIWSDLSTRVLYRVQGKGSVEKEPVRVGS